MITPRITRLVRVPDLRAMHAAVAALTEAPDDHRGSSATHARGCAVIVPSRGAAEALRRTLEGLRLTPATPALVMPDLVTRGELYDRLHERMPAAPPRLSEFEREVIFRRAALDASGEGTPAPFHLRAGLIVEILAFYDELRRRDKTIAAFERLMIASLEPSAGIDRGAERLLRLTRFLSAAFAIFEARVAAAGRVDEHGLRGLLRERGSQAYRHVIVTVPDQSADPRGLWMADYDLLARMPGIDRVDIVATENVLAAGFHQRIHDVLPGIDEVRQGRAAALPVLSAPLDRLPRSRRGAGGCRPAGQDAAAWGARSDSGGIPAAAAVPLPRASGVRGCAGPVSGARFAAARGRAVCRGARPDLLVRDRGGHARVGRRTARLAALVVPGCLAS